jgi:hypothetical protein
MINKLLLSITILFAFNACISKKHIDTKELNKVVANKENIVNNYYKDILKLNVNANIETLSVLLPKDNITVRIKITVPNIEDVLYMNLSDNSKFKINKLLKRVSSLNAVDLTQDAWMFEPSTLKDTIILQLYLPAIYLYDTQYNPKLLFSYKRSSRSLQESIQFNFIKQNYFVKTDKKGFEIPDYGDMIESCKYNGNKIDPQFLEQIDKLNKNRVSTQFKQQLQRLCE